MCPSPLQGLDELITEFLKQIAITHLDLGITAVPMDDGLVRVNLRLQRGVFGGVAVGLLGQRPHELVIRVRLCVGGTQWFREE